MKKIVIALGMVLASLGCVFAQTPTVILVDFTKAVLAWDWEKGNGGNVELFLVKCGNVSGNYTLVVSVPSTSRQVNVSAVIPTVGEYFCVVTAKNKFGESGPSNEIHFEAGLAPVGPANLRMLIP